MDDRGPTDEQLAELAAAVIVIARKLSIRSEEIREVIALNGTEAEVIRTIHLNPGLSATEVAIRSGMQRSNVSAALRVLEARGLVTKHRSEVDARQVVLLATPKAVENLSRVRAGWADRLRQAGGGALEDAVAVTDVLARFARRMDLPSTDETDGDARDRPVA